MFATSSFPRLSLKAANSSKDTTVSTVTKIAHGGVAYNFTCEPPQKYMCSICMQLASDPHLTACCGQEFCEECLKKWEKASSNPACPHCRNAGFVHIQDKQAKREIDELKTLCSHSSRGCNWQGGLGDIKNHLGKCDFSPVKCKDCSAQVSRKALEEHAMKECPYRKSACTYCGEKGKYYEVISFSHWANCPSYPLDCPNKCGAEQIKRSEVFAHRNVCPTEPIDCPLKCASGPLLRKDLDTHIKSNQDSHLIMLIKAFKETQNQLELQGKQLKELRMFRATTEAATAQISSHLDQLLKKSLTTELSPLRSIMSMLGNGDRILNSEHTAVTFVLPNYSCFEWGKKSKLLKPKSVSWESLPFYLQEGYKVSLVILPGVENELGAKLQLLAGEFDNELPWPCNVSFNKISLSIESGDSSPTSTGVLPKIWFHTTGRQLCPSSPSRSSATQLLWHAPKFMNLLPPYPSALRLAYLQNDCLKLKLVWDDSATAAVFQPKCIDFSSLHEKVQELSLKKSNITSSDQSNTGMFTTTCTVSVSERKRARRRKY